MQRPQAGHATPVAIWMRIARSRDHKRLESSEEVPGRTDVTPHRRSVDGVPIPYDGVDKEYKASKCSPSGVHARSDIPGCQMPPKGNGRQDESDTGEHGEHSVRDGHQERLGDRREKRSVGREKS